MKQILPLLLGIMFCSAGAVANPMLLDTIKAVQLPNTMHVQLTYAGGLDAVSIESATRDNSPLVGDWTATSSFATNLGSGVMTVGAYQFCDCNMSAGSHLYRLGVQRTTTKNGTGTTTTTTTTTMLTIGISVSTGYTGPAPQQTGGATGAGGMMPWNEPDPTEIQGLDCVVNCQTAPSGAGGAGGTGGVSTSTVVAATGGTIPVGSTTGDTNPVGSTTGGTNPVGSTTGGTNPVGSTTGDTNPIATTTGGTNPVVRATGGASTVSTKSTPDDDGGCSLSRRTADRYGLAWLGLAGVALLCRRRR